MSEKHEEQTIYGEYFYNPYGSLNITQYTASRNYSGGNGEENWVNSCGSSGGTWNTSKMAAYVLDAGGSFFHQGDYLYRVSVPNRSVNFTDNDLNSLLIKLNDVVRNHSFNFSGAVAEIDETAKMIGDTAKNIAKGLDKLGKGDYRGAARAIGLDSSSKLAAAKTIAGGTLQYKFGIAPLLHDITSGAESIAKRATDLSYPRVEKVEAVWFKPEKYEDNYRSHRESMLVKFKLPITIYIKDPAPFTKPPDARQVAWERVSMSWAIDYVLPVGDYLNALDLSPLYKDEVICDTRLFLSRTIGKDYHTSSEFTSGRRDAAETRFVFTRNPRPFSAALPVIVNPGEWLNVGRAVNLLSVLTQRLRVK